MKFLYNEKKYDGKFLEVYVDSVINDKNKLIKWERCSRKNNTKGVMIVAKHIDLNKYILISEYRIPIKDREIGFPAGLIEEGESVENAVKREIKEETGLDLVKINKISPPVYSSSGMTDECVYIAYILVNGKLSTEFLESSEDIIPFVVDAADINVLLKNKSYKWGAKAWVICDNIVQNELR